MENPDKTQTDKGFIPPHANLYTIGEPPHQCYPKQELKCLRRRTKGLPSLGSPVDPEALPVSAHRSGRYSNTPLGGRPNTNEVMMLKMMVLQFLYGPSDPQMEGEANDRARTAPWKLVVR